MSRSALAVVLLTICAQQAQAATGELKLAVDTVWLITAGALVFFMQAGFALLESGMSRAKNAVNVIMKNYTDVCFGSIVFWLTCSPPPRRPSPAAPWPSAPVTMVRI